MPLINDSEESLERVCAAAARNGASSFSAAPLFLKPCAAQVFLPFLEERFPHLVRRYRERFEKTAYLKGHYPRNDRRARGAHPRAASNWPWARRLNRQYSFFKTTNWSCFRHSPKVPAQQAPVPPLLYNAK